MTTVRQDAWTQDEDLLLAEVVLRHIREGSTQLQAFEEVGKALSRTPAACGFRWNSTVRKQYKNGIELAKKQRKELKKRQVGGAAKTVVSEEVANLSDHTNSTQHSLSLDSVISFLQEYQNKEQKVKHYFSELQSFQEKIDSLTETVQALEKENLALKKENKTLKDEYLVLLSIMEKARKLVVKEEEQPLKMKFTVEEKPKIQPGKK